MCAEGVQDSSSMHQDEWSEAGRVVGDDEISYYAPR